ncbi:cell division cycle 20.2, cofactor of APC complex-like [Andrographis paniculata]|uniref:cell division cycle 20.2, cofactor of APC complex-like n=1 Tax=Andrographis paniculata TaxID=175694 RepID=UPI0021E7EBC4|nr:cell division cycle 20.2, cofactor of APC complex-like [Andrographis paniculata]
MPIVAFSVCSSEDYNVLATGGGLHDGSIRTWNTQNGACINNIDTRAQVCGLLWNIHHKEILSGHGYGAEHKNQLCLWKYPSMSAIGESVTHISRILHLTQSPDGLTAVSAGEDETIRFWEVFGPASQADSKTSYLEGLLSLKTTPLR